MKTITVEVDGRFGEEFAGVYEFRQVTQGEYERVLIGYMDAFGKVQPTDVLRVNREMLWLSLVKHPEGVTREKVVQGELPYGLSVKLQDAYDKVNGLSVEEQRFLSGQLDGKSQTLDSPNSCFVSGSGGLKPSTTLPAEEPSSNLQQS
ncbi:MAG: hypothetical protein QXL10_03300 [Candidatus Bathyarchaeia archaeon]